MNIMDKIRQRQAFSVLPARTTPPEHKPQMLYIGCIDARLDPIDDIGIEKGTALIFRNIGALVVKDDRGGGVTGSTSIGAVLEFFINHFVAAEDKLKHIVISGHTDCGGLKACQMEQCSVHDHYLPLYLESLHGIRDHVRNEARAHNWDDVKLLHAFEEESVRQSMRNLLTYPFVRQAIGQGKLQAHGWVIDTATQRISEMNPETLKFEPM